MSRFKGVTMGFVLFVSLILAPLAHAYSDVPTNHVFKKEIDHLVELGAISGYPDGTYKPSGNVTRGQAAKIITVALKMALIEPTNPTFKDVPRTHDFYSHIETLVAYGVINGYSDGTFKPSNPVKRSHMAKIISNSLGLTEERDIYYLDVPRNNEFYPYINRLATAGITMGRGDGTFGMNENVNRGQMAAFVSRGVNKLNRDNNPLYYDKIQLGMTHAKVLELEGTPTSGSKYDLLYNNVGFGDFPANVRYSFDDSGILYGIFYEVNLNSVVSTQTKAKKVFEVFLEDFYQLQFEKPNKLENFHAEWVINGNIYVDFLLDLDAEPGNYTIYYNVLTY